MLDPWTPRSPHDPSASMVPVQMLSPEWMCYEQYEVRRRRGRSQNAGKATGGKLGKRVSGRGSGAKPGELGSPAQPGHFKRFVHEKAGDGQPGPPEILTRAKGSSRGWQAVDSTRPRSRGRTDRPSNGMCRPGERSANRSVNCFSPPGCQVLFLVWVKSHSTSGCSAPTNIHSTYMINIVYSHMYVVLLLCNN